MDEVLIYFEEQTEKRKQVMFLIHDLLIRYPEVSVKLAYGIPFYYRKKRIAYLNPVKPDGVEFVFTEGRKLSNAQGLLDDMGRKEVAGIICNKTEEIHTGALHEMIHQAFLPDVLRASYNQGV